MVVTEFDRVNIQEGLQVIGDLFPAGKTALFVARRCNWEMIKSQQGKRLTFFYLPTLRKKNPVDPVNPV